MAKLTSTTIYGTLDVTSVITGNGSGLTTLNASNISSGTLSLDRIGTITIAKGGTNLTALGTANQILRVNAGATALEYFTPPWTTNTGTVTSVGLSAPTGFTVTNSPVTTSGTLTLSFSTGYSLPSDATQSGWTTTKTTVDNGAASWNGAATHAGLTSGNPHNVTASDVGLGNVTNESKATMFTSPTFTGTVTSAGITNNGSLGTRASALATAATQILVVSADPSATTRTIQTRTPAQILSDIGAYAASNPSGYTTNTGTVTSVSAGTQISGMSMTITNGTTTPSIATSITNAANFRTAIGAGTGNGTVTSVSGTGSIDGLTLSGSVTTSGSLTLGGSISISASKITSGILGQDRGGTGIDPTTIGNGELLIGNDTLDAFAKANLTAGSNVTITNGAGTITIAATNTTYSAMTSTVLGLGKLFSDTTQNVAANAVTSAASRTYGVQFNSSDQLVVNVPWVNTNTLGGLTDVSLTGVQNDDILLYDDGAGQFLPYPKPIGFKLIRDSSTFTSVNSGDTSGSITCTETISASAQYAIEVNNTSSTTASMPKILIVSMNRNATTSSTAVGTQTGWVDNNGTSDGRVYAFGTSYSSSTIYFWAKRYVTMSALGTSLQTYTLYVRRIWRII